MELADSFTEQIHGKGRERIGQSVAWYTGIFAQERSRTASTNITEYSIEIVDVDTEAYVIAQPTVSRLFGLLGQSYEVSFFVYICFGSRVADAGTCRIDKQSARSLLVSAIAVIKPLPIKARQVIPTGSSDGIPVAPASYHRRYHPQ